MDDPLRNKFQIIFIKSVDEKNVKFLTQIVIRSKDGNKGTINFNLIKVFELAFKFSDTFRKPSRMGGNLEISNISGCHFKSLCISLLIVNDIINNN